MRVDRGDPGYTLLGWVERGQQTWPLFGITITERRGDRVRHSYTFDAAYRPVSGDVLVIGADRFLHCDDGTVLRLG